jgi:hypothetical protein
MAPSHRTPTRQSTCTSKPTARKRAQSESVSSPQQRRKRARRTTLVPYRPARRQPLPQSNIVDNEVRLQLSILDEEDEDIADNDDDDDDDDDVEEQQEEVEGDIMKYPSVWKAVVNGKENLTSWSAIYTDNELHMYMIRHWQDEVIEKAQPRQLTVVKLEAVASFERCRAVDECPFDLQNQQDIVHIHEMLRMWYKQNKRVSVWVTLYLREDIAEPQSQPDSSARAGGAGRRTATQRQLADLPMVLQSEQSAGNLMPQIADRWPCKNSQCRNKGKTC